MNTQPIHKFFALLSRDKNGNEGICMLNVPGLGPQLAVTADEKNLARYTEICGSMDARMEAHSAGLEIVIAEFDRVSTKKL